MQVKGVQVLVWILEFFFLCLNIAYFALHLVIFLRVSLYYFWLASFSGSDHFLSSSLYTIKEDMLLIWNRGHF